MLFETLRTFFAFNNCERCESAYIHWTGPACQLSIFRVSTKHEESGLCKSRTTEPLQTTSPRCTGYTFNSGDFVPARDECQKFHSTGKPIKIFHYTFTLLKRKCGEPKMIHIDHANVTIIQDKTEFLKVFIF